MQIIEGGDILFKSMTFGLPSMETFNYFQELGRDFSSRITSVAKSKLDEVSHLYKAITLNDMANSLKGLINNLENFKLPNVIMQLDSLAELQNAPDVMIPYIMANPTIHKLYERNMVDGYSSIFVGMGENSDGSNPLYQSVMNGIRTQDEDGEYWTHYYSDVRVGDLPNLELEQQVNILATWDALDYFISLGDCDPTSRYNSKL